MILIVDAGTHLFRGIPRICRLKIRLAYGKDPVVELTESIPQGAWVIPVTLKSFKLMATAYQITFRKVKYRTEEQRRAGRARSLKKYRSSPKFRARRMLRRNRPFRPLTQAEIEEIRTSSSTWRQIATTYHISFADIRAIHEGTYDPTGSHRRLLERHGSMEALPECDSGLASGQPHYPHEPDPHNS